MTHQTYIDGDWAHFINEMFDNASGTNVSLAITGNDATLQGMTDSGDEFAVMLCTDENGVRAVRRVAEALHFAVREFASYPALVDITEEGF